MSKREREREQMIMAGRSVLAAWGSGVLTALAAKGGDIRTLQAEAERAVQFAVASRASKEQSNGE